MTHLESLRNKLAQIGGEMAALTAAVQAENNRPMTAEENTKFLALDADFRTTEASITNTERTEEITARLATVQPRMVLPTDATPPPAQGRTTVTGGTLVAHGYPNHGFKMGFGEQLLKIREAATTGRVDPRLMVNAITTFGGENVGADGGFALAPQFAQEIMSGVIPEESFLRGLRTIPTNSNLIVVPANEDTPWSSSGVVPAKTAEGATITATKPIMKKVNVVMTSVKALVHVSEESLSDIPFLASFVQSNMAEKLNYKVENYVMNGTGQDEPLGIMNAPGLITLSDVASTASVIGAQDVFAMKAGTLPGAGAFWVVSPTVLPYIWSLKTDATAGYPLFTPDMTKAPEGMLLGLPMYRSETCPAFNTTGDIVLVVPSGYLFAMNGGINTATTIAFAFDQQLQSFRASIRIGGQPLLSAKVTRANGSTYASHLLCLQSSRS